MLKDSGAAMQTSGARTRGPNPTAARPKAIATRTHYSIAHTLGQLFLLTAAARLLKSILPKSLKAIPGDFPLKSILGTLLSLSEGKTNRISSQVGNGSERNRGNNADNAEVSGLRNGKQGGTG